MTDKKKLRRELRERRIRPSAVESMTTCRTLMSSDMYRESRQILIYLPLPDEIDTGTIVDRAFRDGKQILVPRVLDNEGMMEFVILKRDWRQNLSKGICSTPETAGESAEPDDGALIIIPGVAFGRDCSRLGRGKGYYDRYLSLHRNLKKIGLCSENSLLDSVPHDEKDMFMDAVICSDDVYWARKS